jgi:hypothetical protein
MRTVKGCTSRILVVLALNAQIYLTISRHDAKKWFALPNKLPALFRR